MSRAGSQERPSTTMANKEEATTPGWTKTLPSSYLFTLFITYLLTVFSYFIYSTHIIFNPYYLLFLYFPLPLNEVVLPLPQHICHKMGLDIALHLLATVRLLNVLHSPIQDCDEVFNYLDPLNFVTRGFGKQTWEYSPIYAIRSYAYLLPLSLLMRPVVWLSESLELFPIWWTFYFVRGSIAAFTVYSEYTLFTALKSTLKHKDISNWYLLFTLVNTGYSHASVALLPSAFGMSCVTLSLAFLIKFTASKKTRHSLLSVKWLIIGSFWGWPFVAALCLPLVTYVLLIASKIMLNRFILWSLTALFFNLVLIMQIDYSFYHKTMVIPLNIVLYNVLNTNELKGPDIFGTEPLQYYIDNLILNFNIIALLAFGGLLLIPLFSQCKKINDTGFGFKELVVTLSGLPLWTAVFFKQPHKEERFMYPVYSLINVSAAFAIHYLINIVTVILNFITSSQALTGVLRRFFMYITVALVSLISILRTIALCQNYNGYIELFKHIPPTVPSALNTSTNHITICAGEDWYHYPSSLFLPSTHRFQFIESSFHGLLPGDFLESDSIFDGVRHIPSGMNDMNQYDPEKVVPIQKCDYLVEKASELDGWEKLYDVEVINTEKSHGLMKLIWLPHGLKNFVGEKLGEVVFDKVGLFKKIQH